MTAVKIFQVLWACLLLLVIGVPSFMAGSAAGTVVGLIPLAYLMVTIACWRDNRIAWFIAVIVPAIPVLIWLPMICVNFYMFFTNHALYQDSPATILIVAASTIFFVIPALLIYFCLYLVRKRLAWILFPASSAQSETALSQESLSDSEAGANPYSSPKSLG